MRKFSILNLNWCGGRRGGQSFFFRRYVRAELYKLFELIELGVLYDLIELSKLLKLLKLLDKFQQIFLNFNGSPCTLTVSLPTDQIRTEIDFNLVLKLIDLLPIT